ncbi:hypothetical protein ACLKMY_40545 [Paraburkholderia mimosarum]|uniref:hypothetical protein n=1 Tax=Paraburkholderia mimosarum TaxID=312026 RepID=UPI0012B544CB|nr:hypothetical protein [Paraburkholderia mimosarum]
MAVKFGNVFGALAELAPIERVVHISGPSPVFTPEKNLQPVGRKILLSIKKMNACKYRRTLAVMAIASLSTALSTSAVYAQSSTSDTDAKLPYAQASKEQQKIWQEAVKQMGPPPGTGCYSMSYPETTWQKATCAKVSHPAPAPKHAPPAETKGKVTMNQWGQTAGNQTDYKGNRADYIAQTTGLTTSAIGSFPGTVVSGLADTGLANESRGYTLQLNTNFGTNASYCAQNGFHPDCRVWQQFIYSSDYGSQDQVPRGPQIFIQDWIMLINSDDYNRCPAGWDEPIDKTIKACYKNSLAVAAPYIPVGNLYLTTLAGYASTSGSGATDTVMLTYNGNAYSVNQPEATLDIGQVWKQSEFNIFGNGNGSRLYFKPKTSITVNLQVNDATTYAPQCLPGGTTGETNNLTLGACIATPGVTPSIQFTESN